MQAFCDAATRRPARNSSTVPVHVAKRRVVAPQLAGGHRAQRGLERQPVNEDAVTILVVHRQLMMAR